MSPSAAYPTPSLKRTRSVESEAVQVKDEDVYSQPLSSYSNAIVKLRPSSPLQTIGIMRSLSSSSSQTSRSEGLEDDKDSREGSVSAGSTKSEEKVEKRKRLRVTPEQLQHLERFFIHDRNPTAVRRREIGELLGMQERQTQIWFQNRRAKAKLLNGRQQQHKHVTVERPPPDSPPQLSPGIQVDLHNLIHEDHTVTIIPCTDLSIGSWRRIAMRKHDLVAYVSDVKRCLIWFIHTDGFGRKMEIPFNTIVGTSFTDTAPRSGRASFLLSESPLFYTEVEHQSTNGNFKRHWEQCPDWTGEQQASRVLHHELSGSAHQLVHLLRNLHDLRDQSARDISLHRGISPVTMEIPPPPLAAIAEPGFQYRQHDAMEPSVSHHSSHFDNSFGGAEMTPSSDFYYLNDGDRPSPYSAPNTMSGSFAQQELNFPQQRCQPSSAVYSGEHGPAYTGFENHRAIHRSLSVGNVSENPISHGLVPRPYSAQAMPRSFSPQGVQPYDVLEDDLRRRRSTTPSSTTSAHTTHEQPNTPLLHPQHQQRFYMQPGPSPPLLTRPFFPQSNRPLHDDHISRGPSPLSSSYPGIEYQT